MSDVVVDAFKFLAVRPAQLAAHSSRTPRLMQDPRADELGLESSPARTHLLTLSRALAQPDVARQRWNRLDLSALLPLVRSYESLEELYAGTSAPPDPAAAAANAGLDLDDERARNLGELAWDALYTAYQTGPDAGPLLEVPTAALRALQFGVLARAGLLAEPADARAALSARALVPPIVAHFDAAALEGGPPSDLPREPGPTPPTEPAISPDVERIGAVMAELIASQRLLQATRTATRPATPATTTVVPDQTQPAQPESSGRFRSEIRVSTAPRFRDLMTGPLTDHEGAVTTKLALAGATVPAATQTLQGHVSSLMQEVYALRSDPALPLALARFQPSLELDEIVKVLPPLPFPVETDPGTAPDVDVAGRIRPLGIGDLLVVKQTLLAYEPGEVAHIENVLKGESKERKYRVLDRTENTFFSSEENTEETERDTQSTDRFELKKEAEQTISEDMKIEAGLNVTGAYGPVVVTATGDFAYSTSKKDSAKSSATFAREVVDRSVAKIQKKVKNERTTKVFHEVESTDTHGIDNTAGSGHVTGVYRWVDKRYSAQVYNYGVRLMLEFVVPEPAAYFLASQILDPVDADVPPPEPFLNAKGQPLTPADVTESTYRILAGRYNAAGVTTPPAEWAYVSTAFEQGGIANGAAAAKSAKDLVVPDGYTLVYYMAQVALTWENHPQFALQIAEETYHLENNTTARRGAVHSIGPAQDPAEWDNPRGSVPVSLMCYDINAYAVNVSANCRRDEAKLQTWQLQTFDKIYTAYKALKTEYDQKVAAARTQAMTIGVEGRNPARNRQIEKEELKKLCITMLTGLHLKGFDSMTNPADAPTHIPEVNVLEALDEGPIIQFFEQAFDWEQLTYLFFPYFWGRKSKWIEAGRRTDPDPLFMSFLQAGSARVVLPVSEAYRDAILFFLQQKPGTPLKKIWNGGGAPTINDPLFRSIAAEMRDATDDLQGATPQDTPWEFTVPTTLVWLQPGPELPVFP